MSMMSTTTREMRVAWRTGAGRDRTRGTKHDRRTVQGASHRPTIRPEDRRVLRRILRVDDVRDDLRAEGLPVSLAAGHLGIGRAIQGNPAMNRRDFLVN